MIGNLFDAIDSVLACLLADAARVAFWSVVAGVGSLAVYAKASPQRRLKALEAESADIRASLSRYDGDFAGAWPLIRRNLELALKRLGLVMGPSLLAGLPAVLIWFWLDDRYGPPCEVLHVGPEWARGYLTVFLVAACVSSLAVKRLLRIA